MVSMGSAWKACLSLFPSGLLALSTGHFLTFEGLRMALEAFRSEMVFAKDNTKRI